MPEPKLQPALGMLAVIPSAAEIDALLAGVVRGEAADWRTEWRGKSAQAAFIDRVDYHGLSSLLADRRARTASWPEQLRAAVAGRAIAAAMWEIRHRLLLAELTSALASAGVDAVLLKGSALAYSHYPKAAVRERGDSDLLVDSGQRFEAREILSRLGFRRSEGNLWPEAQLYQESWDRRHEDGTLHSIDLHFDLFNTPVLAGKVTVAECVTGRMALPAIGPDASAPGRAILLYHACLHRETNRVARYFVRNSETTGGDRLIWLMDIDLLTRSMAGEDWDGFLALVERTHQSAACLGGLDAAARWLGTPIPAEQRSALERGRSRSHPYLACGQLGRAAADVAAVPGLAAKIRYALARLFPDQGVIRAKYADGSDRSIASLYARRVRDAAVRPRRTANR